MPVPDQRDPAVTSAALTAWLRERLPGVEDLVVSGLTKPSLSGYSNETLLFDVQWSRAGVLERRSLVARVGPTAYRLFPDARFEDQHRLMRILDRETDLPLPPVRWYEPDGALLGAPFLVMDRVNGLVPPDTPTYHQEGWVVEASPAERARLWWGALEVLARVHLLDPEVLGLGFLDRPDWGRTGIDQQLGYYEHFLRWGHPGRQPAAEAALAWLRRHQPDEALPPRLLWGDARLGNIVFHDGEPRAVLDWEMATLGQPEVDLAWFLYLDRHHWEGVGAARLAGFPDRRETVAAHERRLGRPLRNLDYYEVFAALRFAVIMARLGQMFIDFELLPQDSTFPVDNTASRLLARILDDVTQPC